MLVRGATLEDVDVALPDRADRRARRTSRSARGTTAVAAEGEDGQPRAPARRAGPTARRTLDADACFVFIGAAPRTDWLDGVVARDERGFILAGPDAQAAGWPLKRDPYLLETTRARRLRGRRRARALDQARRERGRRGLDGRLARPPVPGRRMTAASPSPTCAASTSSTSSTTSELDAWAAVAQVRDVRAGRRLAEQGDDAAGPAAAARGRRSGRCCRRRPHRARRPPATRRPGWARSPRSRGGPLPRAACRPRPPAASRCIAPEDFRRLALAHPAVHQRVMRAGRAGHAAGSPASSRTASGSRRSGRWPRGSRTSSTTRRRPRARAAAQLRRRSTS